MSIIDPSFLFLAALTISFPIALFSVAYEGRKQQIRYKTHKKNCPCHGCWEDNNLSQR